MIEVVENSNLHFEHKLWESELAFWKDEMKFFNQRLDELVHRGTDKEVLARLDQFQNQFAIHESIVTKYAEAIEKHEVDIAAHSRQGENVLDRNLTHAHQELREKMERQRELYAELKKEFFRFLSEVM